jgi:hypothetical protein
MFKNNSGFNGDLSGWRPTSCSNFGSMFDQATSFDQNISLWLTSPNVADRMDFMFQNTPFNQNIDGWDVSTVTNFIAMFADAASFNQSLNSWDMSAATAINAMFFRATSFNGNITSWNTLNVTTFQNLFSSASAFNQDIGAWNVASLTNGSGMFNNAPAMSSANTDALLIGWAAQAPNIQSGVTLTTAGNRTAASDTAVATLTGAPYNWIIT